MKGEAYKEDMINIDLRTMIKDMELTELDAQTTLAIRLETTIHELKTIMGTHFPGIWQTVMNNGGKVTGQPFSIYRRFEGEEVDIELGIPIEKEFENSGDYHFSQFLKGKLVKSKYYGPYSDLDKGMEELRKWSTENDINTALPYAEIYVDDPMEIEDVSELRTDIFASVVST